MHRTRGPFSPRATTNWQIAASQNKTSKTGEAQLDNLVQQVEGRSSSHAGLGWLYLGLGLLRWSEGEDGP